jgi:hypothetical protein
MENRDETQVTDTLDEIQQENISEVAENLDNSEVEENQLDSDLANLTDAQGVDGLVKKAKILVDEANAKYDEVFDRLKTDLADYQNAKEDLKSTVVDVNGELETLIGYQQDKLDELEAQEEGIQYQEEQEALDSVQDSIEVLSKDDFAEAPEFKLSKDIAPMYVQEPSSGGFGAFLMGLIGGGATFASMAYFASTKLGIKLDPSKMPDMEVCKPIFDFYAKLVKQTDPNIGMGLMGGSALLVFLIIYKMKKSSRATKNLEFAKAQLAQAEEFVAQKEDAKARLEEIDEHCIEAINTFKLYDVVLNEEKAKLARIRFIEDDKIASGNFHSKSIQEMEDTQELISNVKEYVATPMVDESNTLSQEIKKALANLKAKIDSVVSRLY